MARLYFISNLYGEDRLTDRITDDDRQLALDGELSIFAIYGENIKVTEFSVGESPDDDSEIPLSIDKAQTSPPDELLPGVE